MRTRPLRWVILLAVILGQPGCGDNYHELPIGFINLTGKTADSYLMARWLSAQAAIAVQVDLNPIGRLHGESPLYLPGDSRAYNIPPRQIEVQAVPDVSSQQLLAGTGVLRPDPTGFILCPQPCNVTYDSSYTLFSGRYVAYAASWELASDPQAFAQILEYEFQSQILYRLGYEVSKR
jgi:hypothetical protein